MPSLSRRRFRHLVLHRDVPAADEDRGDRADIGVEPGGDAPLDAAMIGLRRRHVVLAREQQRHVDRDAGEDRLLDRRQALLGAGNLDQKVRPAGAAVQVLGHGQRALGIVGQQRRHLERHPAVDAVGAVVDRPEQVRRARQVLDRQVEEQILGRSRLAKPGADRGVVGAALADGVVEDRRIRGEPGDRQLVQVARERTVVEHVARDVVEPEALTKIVELCGCFHRNHSGAHWGSAWT